MGEEVEVIAVICLAIAAALLFWPEVSQEEAANEPLAPSSSKTSANPKVRRRRKEAPKNERKE